MLPDPIPADLLNPATNPTMKVEDAARVFQVSRSTMYDYVRRGVVPSIRLSSRKTVIPTAALVRLLNVGADLS